jgi:hypothetical protein
MNNDILRNVALRSGGWENDDEGCCRLLSLLSSLLLIVAPDANAICFCGVFSLDKPTPYRLIM